MKLIRKMTGTVALKFDGSWSSGDYSKLPFKAGFAGIPGGRSCVVPDFLIISEKSKNRKEAYEFDKYMSTYSLEGFTKRIELSKTNNTIVSSLPMVKDKKLINNYFSTLKIKGLETAYSEIQNRNTLRELKFYLDMIKHVGVILQILRLEKLKMQRNLFNFFQGNLKINYEAFKKAKTFEI